MATNKHALLRYKALDSCFSNFNKRFYVKDLIEACNRAIADYYGIDPDREVTDDNNRYFIHRRSTLYDDIEFMRERWDASIKSYRDGRLVYYRYDDEDFSISKKSLSEEEVSSLRETLIMLNRFKGMPHFEWMEGHLSKLEELEYSTVWLSTDSFEYDYKGKVLTSFSFNNYVRFVHR